MRNLEKGKAQDLRDKAQGKQELGMLNAERKAGGKAWHGYKHVVG